MGTVALPHLDQGDERCHLNLECSVHDDFAEDGAFACIHGRDQELETSLKYMQNSSMEPSKNLTQVQEQHAKSAGTARLFAQRRDPFVPI